MQVLNVIYITWLLVRRSIIIWIALFIFMLFNFLGFSYITSPEEFFPGMALTGMSSSVQGGILAFLLFGVLLIRMEERHQLNELYHTMKRGFLNKFFGKIIFSVLFIFFICLAVYILLATKFILSGLPFSTFYIDSFLYILLYWGLTFFISMLIGMLLALIFKGKFVYPLVFLVWPVIGPVNEIVFTQVAIHIQGLGTTTFANMYNLGEYNPFTAFNAFYGYSLELFHWVKRWVWLAVLFSIILFIISLKSKENRKQFISVSIVLIISLIPAISFLKSPQFILDSNQPIYEPIYYRDYNMSDVKNPNVQLENYDIQLDVDWNLEAIVKADLLNLEKEKIDQATLTLYHQFLVYEITANGRILEFQQDKDQITVYFPESVKSNGEIELTFKYAGVSSPLFFANKRAVYLPYYFPWLPSAKQAPAMLEVRKGIHRVNHQNSVFTDYNLRFNGPDIIFTNLDQSPYGTWEKHTNGITLIAGNVQKDSIDGFEVIYPNTWERGMERFPEFVKFLAEVAGDIQKDMQMDEFSLPHTFIYLPVLSIGDMYTTEYMWKGHDHFIFNELPYKSPDKDMLFFPDSLLVQKMVSALTWKNVHLGTEIFDYVHAFDLVYTHAYMMKNDMKTSGGPLGILGSMMEKASEPDKQGALYTIYYWVRDSQDYEAIIDFCREWYRTIQNGELDWTALEEIARSYVKKEGANGA